MILLKKINLLFVMCIFFTFNISASTNNVDCDTSLSYPFPSDPTLSWDTFEKQFRQKYSGLDIPFIKLENDKEDSIFYERNTKTIQLSPRCIVNPAETEWKLLHEAGHHNYPKDKRNQNINTAIVGMTALSSAAAVPILRNLYYTIKNNNVPIIKGFRNLAIFWAGSSFSTSIVLPYLKMQSEEKAADAFANKHGSQQALEAQREQFSRQGFLQTIKSSIEAKFKSAETAGEPLTMQQKEEIENIKRIYTRIFTKLAIWSYDYKPINIFMDPEHPSYKSRYATVAQALKDRFGIGSKE